MRPQPYERTTQVPYLMYDAKAWLRAWQVSLPSPENHLCATFFHSHPVSCSPREAAMAKRSYEDQNVGDRSAKRLRPNHADRLSQLSDELLLRTLSYLSVSDLVLCQRCACKM